MTEETDRPNPKPPPVDRLSQLWQRIKDHKMVQWSVAYVALAYGIQHGVILTSESFGWPNAVARISMLLLVFGLPVVMTFAWYHGERASQQFTKAELSILSALLVIGSLLFYAFVRPSEEVAAVTASAVQQAGIASGALFPTQASGISIAVLPFVNLSSDKEQEFFSDGMTEEITSALAKVKGLNVVARTSAFEFKGQSKDVRTIGQALSATHLIEGSVRKAGDRVRITAQLVRSDTGAHLWTDSYDRELKDIFATQSDIAEAIAGALRVPLGLKQGDTLVSNRTNDLDSYQQYLRAKALVRARRLVAGTDAIALLEQVVKHDPNYAPAWALLAQAYDLTPQYYRPGLNSSSSVEEERRVADASLPKAEAAARRAVELDPNLADGHLSLGLVQQSRGKHLLAEDSFKQALTLDPNHPDTLHLYGDLLAGVGRLKEALVMQQHLRAVEPFVPVFNSNAATVLWLNGQNDAAIAILKDSPSGVGRGMLAEIYASMGRYSEAADTVLQNSNVPRGIVEEEARLLRTAPATAASPQSLPPLGGGDWVYLYVGALNRVLEQGENNIEAGYLIPIGAAEFWHPSYAPLRKTERFKAVVRKAGLVDYWRERGWPEFCHPTGADDFVCE
jgi:TolB-like protein